MSEPAGIIGLIKIDEKSLRHYLKFDSAQLLINSIHEAIKSESDDFYIFKFDKKNEMLSILISYDGGDSETVQGNDFIALKELSRVFTHTTNGFLIGYNNIINQEEIIFALEAQPSGWGSIENSKINEFQYDIIDTFKLTSQFIQEKLSQCYSSKFLFAPIIANLNKLAKKENQINTLVNIPNATPVNPVNLFNNFYYNGHHVFYIERGVHILEDLDPHSLRSTKYGASDEVHVVVKTYNDNYVTLKTDVKKFKSLSDFNRQFYLTETQVYDGADMTLIPEASPKSFKILSYSLQEDHERYYFYNRKIEKKDIGDYKIVPCGYYRESDLFLSKTLVLCKNDEIDPKLIDIDTFKVGREFQVSSAGKDELALLNYMIDASDKEGNLLIVSYKNKASIDIIRDLNEIAAYIEAHEVTLAKFYNEVHLTTDAYKAHFLRDPLDRALLSDMSKLFADYSNSYKKDKNKKWLDEIINRYEFISQSPFLPNNLYQDVILAYHGLGQDVKMLDAIERALLNGCNKLDPIWALLDKSSLKNNSKYQQLRAFNQKCVKVDNKTIIDEVLLDAILSPATDQSTMSYLTDTLFYNVYFPSLKEIETFKTVDPNTIFINNQEIDWDEYTDKLIQVFGLFFPEAATYLKSLIALYQHHEYIPIKSFLNILDLRLMQYQFLKNIGGYQISMADIMTEINNLIVLISLRPEAYQKEAYHSLYNSDLYKVLFPAN